MMKGKVFMTTQINPSPTIAEKAGADIEDVRGLLLKYDDNGAVVPAAAGEKVIGIGIITNSENLKTGDTVDIQVKEMGLVLAGAEFKKGVDLAADADGKAVEAAEGNYVIGTALQAATAAGELVKVQICKYKA